MMNCNVEPGQRGQPGFVKMVPPLGKAASRVDFIDGAYVLADDGEAGEIWVAEGGAVQDRLRRIGYVPEATA